MEAFCYSASPNMAHGYTELSDCLTLLVLLLLLLLSVWTENK